MMVVLSSRETLELHNLEVRNGAMLVIAQMPIELLQQFATKLVCSRLGGLDVLENIDMQTILNGEGTVKGAWGCLIFELKKYFLVPPVYLIAVAIFVTTNLIIIVSEGYHAYRCSLTEE
jgi:hypothetical protein